MKSIDIDSGGPVMPAVEVPGHLQVGGKLRVFQMADAGQGDARVGQLVVEPGRGPVAEVRAHRRVQRAEHLQQDEQHADERERSAEAGVALHGRHQDTGRDGEAGRQQAAQRQ